MRFVFVLRLMNEPLGCAEDDRVVLRVRSRIEEMISEIGEDDVVYPVERDGTDTERLARVRFRVLFP